MTDAPWSWDSFWTGVAACWVALGTVPLLILGSLAWRDRQRRRHTVEKMLRVGSRHGQTGIAGTGHRGQAANSGSARSQ